MEAEGAQPVIGGVLGGKTSLPQGVVAGTQLRPQLARGAVAGTPGRELAGPCLAGSAGRDLPAAVTAGVW